MSDLILESSDYGNESFFFYGTLLVPDILVRVLGHNCDNLTFQSALLPGHSRHHIKHEDYPAIIPEQQTIELYSTYDLTPPEDISVRGTLVHGLSAQDIIYLDTFEAEEYTRKKLKIQPLSPAYHLSQIPANLQPDGEGGGDLEASEAWTYIWSDRLSSLEPTIWSYEQFMTDKAHAWVGKDKEDMYTDVEARQQNPTSHGPKAIVEEPQEVEQEIPDADETLIEGETVDGYEEFGHNMLKYWKWDRDFLYFNHGAYGSPPIPVLDAMREWTDKAESNISLFLKRTFYGPLTELRQSLSKIIGAQEDEVVLVPNTSHGVNNILHQIKWEEGDIIVTYSTTYGACAQAVKHVCDRYGVDLENIDIAFPCSHESIIQKTETLIQKYNDPAVPSYTGDAKPNGKTPEKRIRMVLIDAIASMPGVIYPWEDIVRLCRKYGIFSLVDAAHAIGQVALDVKRADCDFFVSNCHKWLMSQRANAVMYVPLRNQRLITSTFPTSYMYESAKYPTPHGNRAGFVEQFSWPATVDWIPYLGIIDAIKFRQKIGGEDRILRYNHTLAVQGGRRVAKKWGTKIMENYDLSNGELTAAMVNVQVPIPFTSDAEETARKWKFLEDAMFENKCYVAVFPHAGNYWARFSAQVWLELSDFDRVADILLKICEAINRGEHKPVKVDKLEEGPRPQDVDVLEE